MIDLRGLTVALLFRPSSICRCKWKVGKRSGQTIWASNMCVYIYIIYICINRDTKLCSFFLISIKTKSTVGKGGMANECQVQIFGCIGRTCLVPYHFLKVGGSLPFYWILGWRSVVIIGYLYLIKQQRQDNDFILTLRQIFFDLLSIIVMFIVSFDSNYLSYSISTKCIGGSNILNALFIYLFSGGSRIQTSSNCSVEYLFFLHFLYLLLFSVMRFSLFCGNSLLFLYFLFANMCLF